jgi:hypothetical protein
MASVDRVELSRDLMPGRRGARRRRRRRRALVAVYLTLALGLGAVFALNRYGTLNDDDAAGLVTLVFGALFGFGFYLDRRTSEAVDENPNRSMVPFTRAGFRAGGPWYVVALLVFVVLIFGFRTG